MSTLTISLPTSIAKRLDKEVHTGGFATRSEFIRSLLRRYFGNELAFEEFQPKSLNEIKRKLTATEKYSQKFIESVVGGLKKSSLYAR